MTIKPEPPVPARRGAWVPRLAAPAAIILVTVLALAAPAWAHSRLQRTDPADGSSLTAQISTVTLTFNEMVRGKFTTVVVTGPGGASYSDGRVRVVDDDVHQRVYPLHSGAYTVAWRAISADGHPVEGQFHFSMALPPGQEPAAGPPATGAAVSSTGHGNRRWLWGGAGGAVIVIAAAAYGVTRRRASGQRRAMTPR